MTVISPGSIIGIIGGGQLGRMTAIAAANMGYKTHIYTPEHDSPASHVADYTTVAKYDDKAALKKFADSVRVISYEFENIPYSTLHYLEGLTVVRPGWKALHVSQNRLREKATFDEVKVPTNRYYHVADEKHLIDGFKTLGSKKCILKTAELGYDGKGQVVINSENELGAAWERLYKREAIMEEFVPFEKEISVIIARGVDNRHVIFPVGENVHVRGILDTSVVPAKVPADVVKHAENYALKIAEHLHLVGLLAVEFFVTKDGKVLANEIAPRPHNSGHWTMDGCVTSQFEQFVRAISGLPLGSVEQHSHVMMKNLIGNDADKWGDILKDPSAKLHLYGKTEARPGRKMGHVNYVKAK